MAAELLGSWGSCADLLEAEEVGFLEELLGGRVGVAGWQDVWLLGQLEDGLVGLPGSE